MSSAAPLPQTEPEAPAPAAPPRPRPESRARRPGARAEARRQLLYELISGGSGLVLALFMWGHMVLVGSILTGEKGFDWLAGGMEKIYLAQPTVFAITFLFLLHGALASRKIPSQLRQRRKMKELARGLLSTGPDAEARYG